MIIIKSCVTTLFTNCHPIVALWHFVFTKRCIRVQDKIRWNRQQYHLKSVF